MITGIARKVIVNAMVNARITSNMCSKVPFWSIGSQKLGALHKNEKKSSLVFDPEYNYPSSMVEAAAFLAGSQEARKATNTTVTETSRKSGNISFTG